MSDFDQAVEVIAAWRRDPVRFVRDNFSIEPDLWQVRVLTLLATKPRVGMKACKGPGKTCVLAWAVWWFLACFERPKIACVSITADNLKDGLWTELAKWRNRSPFLGSQFEWTATRVYARDCPEEWFASFRSFAKGSDPNAQADALAGLHADNICFVLDEAGGIPTAVLATAEAALANQSAGAARLLVAGNPTSRAGALGHICVRGRGLWDVVTITSDPDSQERTPRVSPEWAREQISMYGRDNPWVLVNVLGEFPPTESNALLAPEEVESCLGRHLREDAYDFHPRILGVDVARFGDDASTLCPRQGPVLFQPKRFRGLSSAELAARVCAAAAVWQPDQIAIDGTGGWGAGVIDQVRLAGFSVIEVPFAGKARDDRYFNARSEMWFEMKDWIKRGASVPTECTELVRELTEPTYNFQGGKFRLEEKDQIKKRLGYSPDLADGIACTFYLPAAPRAKGSPGRAGGGRVRTTYDPFADAA